MADWTILDRQVQGRRARSGPRVVHEDINAAEMTGKLVNDVPAAIRL
jgi:hypothetical protein